MDLIELSKIFKEYWDDMKWSSPTKEWDIKLTALLQDSIILLKDCIDQSKPFFTLPPLQKDGQSFLENDESMRALKYILDFLKENNIQKLDKEQSKEIINNVSKRQNIKAYFDEIIKSSFFWLSKWP